MYNNVEDQHTLETLALNMCKGNHINAIELLLGTAIMRAVWEGVEPESLRKGVELLIESTQSAMRNKLH